MRIFSKSFCEIASLAFVFASAIFVSSCASSQKSETPQVSDTVLAQNEITMGFMVPMSGPNGEAGLLALKGAMTARDEINSSGGILGKKLNILVADCGAENFSVLETVKNMESKGAKIFHAGFGNDTAFPMKKLGEDNGIFINYLCSYPPAALSGKNCTRIFINGAQEGDIADKFVERNEGESANFVIMHVSDIYGKTNSDYLSFNLKRERTKIYSDTFTRGEKDFSIFASQLPRLGCKYVFYIGYGDELSAFASALGKAGYKGTLFAYCPSMNFTLNESELGKMKICAIKTAFEANKIENSENKNFKKSYALSNGDSPTWISAYAYDSIKLTARAAVAADFKVSGMRAFFENKSYECASGKIEFDSSADSLSELEVEKVFGFEK